MPLALPSLRFQPEFYSGGVSRFHLPLLYDLVTLRAPARIVLLGFGDGQPHFTFCQALREQNHRGHCLTIRRELPDEKARDDAAWENAVALSEKNYGDRAALLAGAPSALAATEAGGAINLLFLDDCDSYEILRAELQTWLPKLAPDGLLLLHGVDLQRLPPPRRAWEEALGQRSSAEFHEGIGLGVASFANDDSWAARIFGTPEARAELVALHRASAARIAAEHSARAAKGEIAALHLRQIWLESLLADRRRAQEIMDEQAGHIAERARAFSELHQDRVQAQHIMDTQGEQLKQWVGRSEALSSENKKLKAEAKKIIAAAKNAQKKKRSIPERIVRELRRIPGNLSRSKAPPPAPVKKAKAAPASPADRYLTWIAEHEPDRSALDEQRVAAATLTDPPLLSLVLPTFNPPANFLEELIASLEAQTFSNFEICIADGGSDAATKERLQRWQEREPRLRLEYLPENFGIAENTNRALGLTSGEFFACIDQDDVLAPFALYEVARAILRHPEGDIFYSDEDRLGGPDGKRHSPFFKPEWNPELLLSFMYLGHLTAYRRALLERVGRFRKEFDLSQDYDFALRATESAAAIFHIPQVLYHWREHSGSGSAGGKPQARTTNLAALGAAMERRGLDAEIIELPTANRARLTITNWPRVSLIVPTDSAERARACLEQLPRMTDYPDYEIVLVTNSRLADSLAPAAAPRVRFVRYDEPFNFSEKCNRGAQAATGSRLIFFNDDVESAQPDWIQNLIEPLENPEIGAVAPKLLYATGKIQHAGLVTGVRGLVGTACHQWPADSADYANFAQSFRDVSALSGACLALRKEDFLQVGGFNATDTPISHSDIDLCFALRAAGWRCVYTPFATMRHAGHASLGEEERKPEPATHRDKSSIHLLRRWGGYVTHDPYFTENMRDWLYSDSPKSIRMFGRNHPPPSTTQLELLFISHDLSLSGAPILLLHLARWCQAHGFFVTVMAPDDGALRTQYEAAGIPLILDPLIMKEHESFLDFLRPFDAVLANTIRGWPAVRAAKKQGVPALWWLHETLVGEHYLREDLNLRLAVREADVIFTPTALTAAVYQPFTDRIPRRLPSGIPDIRLELEDSSGPETGALRFLLLGSIEGRKGQDVFVQALRLLPRPLQEQAKFQIAGRVMDPEFAIKVYGLAQGVLNLQISGETDHAAALDLLESTDVLVCASRDEAMPLTIIEAMCLGKTIVSTTVGGVPEFIRDGENGLLVRPEAAAELAGAIERLLSDREEARTLGRNARSTFEKQFTLDRFGEDFISLVDEMIGKESDRLMDCPEFFESVGARSSLC